MKSKDEKWAIFWCSLLSPLIFNEIEEESENAYLTSLSQEKRLFPNGQIKKASLSTLRRKLNQYREGGFKNLARKIRSDRGKARGVSQEIIDKAIEIKKEQPMRADDTINRFLKVYYGKIIPKSTLYRHLKQAGATKIKLDITKKKVRKRWSRDHTHDLWVGDFQEGPYVLYEGEVLPTYLSLFIDCHSRYVVEGRYYLRQNLDILMDSLLRAWSIHGASKELYLDNAKVYHANALKSACYSIGIKLLHRGPGDPSPGGLVERFFGTSQGQFEAEVRSGDILPLEELNRTFSAYLSVAYHPRIHSETNQPPKERYDQGVTVIRHVDMEEVIQFFMKGELRSVDTDFSDIRLYNRFYRVDKRLRGDRVQVRYDPFSDREKVLIYSLHEEYLGEGILYEREYGDQSECSPMSSKKPNPKHNYLELLKQEHDKQLNAQARGIDYRQVLSQRAWPYLAFTHKIAKLMGRKGELGTFSGSEYEMLKKAYNRFPELDEAMLIEAWQRASYKTIPYVVYELTMIQNQRKGK
jgi:transposase InsO family protein